MDMLRQMTEILSVGSEDSKTKIRSILEDAESPITQKTIQTLYKNTIEKSHVDFGDIPKSKGDITNYSGYKTMIDTIAAIKLIAKEDQTYFDLTEYANIVASSISFISTNRMFYTQAFTKNVEIVKLEYNTFVYACVEAITSLLFQFTDFMKTPSSHKLTPTFKNTKYRADLFFIEQLKSFNEINRTGNYGKYLAAMNKGGTDNFAVSTAFIVGAAAITTAVMTSIIPITRRIIYTIQDARGKLTECLELQAYFLELNQQYLKTHKPNGEDTDKVIKKQEEVRLKFLRLADKLRVKSIKQEELSKKTLNDEDRTITLSSMRDEIDSSEIDIM